MKSPRTYGQDENLVQRMKAIDKLLLWEDEAALLSLSTKDTPKTSVGTKNVLENVKNTPVKTDDSVVQNDSDGSVVIVRVDENGESGEISQLEVEVDVEVEAEVYSDIDSNRVSTNTACVLKALKHMQRQLQQQTLTQSLSQEEAVADFPAGECCPECFFVN